MIAAHCMSARFQAILIGVNKTVGHPQVQIAFAGEFQRGSGGVEVRFILAQCSDSKFELVGIDRGISTFVSYRSCRCIELDIVDAAVKFFNLEAVFEITQCRTGLDHLGDLFQHQLLFQSIRMYIIYAVSSRIRQCDGERTGAAQDQIFIFADLNSGVGRLNFDRKYPIFKFNIQTGGFDCLTLFAAHIYNAFAGRNGNNCQTQAVVSMESERNSFAVEFDFFGQIIAVEDQADFGSFVFVIYFKITVRTIQFNARLTGKQIVCRIGFNAHDHRRNLREHQHLRFAGAYIGFILKAGSVFICTQIFAADRAFRDPVGIVISFGDGFFAENKFGLFGIFNGVDPRIDRAFAVTQTKLGKLC